MKKIELKEFLDEKYHQFCSPDFIPQDPISIPHRFHKKEDIEISAFLTATISWGNRKSVLKSANKMMELLSGEPFDFVLNHSEKDLESLDGFVHRTFNAEDFKFFIQSLKNIYSHHGGLEVIFTQYQTKDSLQPAISKFHEVFFEIPFAQRTKKHVSNPMKGSAAKRINMFLRWMVRESKKGVDFALWKEISPSKLSCPLDVHSGNVGRKLGLLKRTYNDSKALNQLDKSLRKLDKNDPVKYDFALFGLGVEGFLK